MGAQRLSDGLGPHPGSIALPMLFMSQSRIESLLYSRCVDDQERSLVEAKEDSLRLKGIAWLENVRRAMQMPIKTYTTACIYYSRFRLSHPPGTKVGDSYFYSDAAAASLLVACKAEETKKYSRDILAAVHNLKSHEQTMPDDPVFEEHSRAVIELERLILESIKFSFHCHNPHDLLVKLARKMDAGLSLCQKAFAVLTELYRTFAPLKHTAITLCFAALELAAQLDDEPSRDKIKSLHLKEGTPKRADVMEVLLDALDHYARHTSQSILGPRYSLDKFLHIRLAYNRECEANAIPRYAKADPTPDQINLQNGHPTPVSPAEYPAPRTDGRFNKVAERAGTLRFAMNPDDALAETDAITKYLVDDYEEIEEEVEIQEPPRQPAARRALSPERRSHDRRHHRGSDRGRGRGGHPSDRGRHGNDFRRREFDDRRGGRRDHFEGRRR